MASQMMSEALPQYIHAMGVTLKLASIGIALALIIGLISSFVIYFKLPIFQRIVSAYTEISRNTPLLIQLFFLGSDITAQDIVLEGKDQ